MDDTPKDERREEPRKPETDMSTLSLLAVIILALALQIWKMRKGLPYADMIAIYSIQLAAACFTAYKRDPKRKFLLMAGIAASLATAGGIVAFLLGV